MGLLWVLLAILLLAATKYISSLNLKRLQTKIAMDTQAATLLQENLEQIGVEENELIAEMTQLENKEMALSQTVDKLAQKLQALNAAKKATVDPPPEDDGRQNSDAPPTPPDTVETTQQTNV